ncbi:amidohydrolase family protein [Amycolatopsis saalfeldensis]|uniref:Imidazolonepropionase n=1 Tax=Amycolatopsis saalfeldensis TaxID=394193 RepID=A0A1H8YJQ8_9PSEU|nr:amidohydrolase family protein [Amycolatopsis saalfeldensis]SEP52395.1 Imidazolonepropionase [Amycolatopsis saalfeldensis]
MTTPSELLITARWVLRGPRGLRLPHGGVLLRDSVVAAVGPAAEVAAMAGPAATRLVYPHGTVLPGFVDGHVHLSLDGGEDPVDALLRSGPAALEAGVAERARLLLSTGVTTVRDLGDRADAAVRLRDEISAGALPGPRILAASAPLTPPGGHCWFLGGEVSGDQEILAKVRRNAAAGADVIKVMASGGYITAGGAEMRESQFDERQLGLIVAEAGRFGLPVAAHAHGIASIVAAANAGVRTVEHCLWLDEDDRVTRPEKHVRALAEQGIAACCTVSGHDWRRKVETEGEAAARAFYGRIGWMHERGVPLIVGTDAGIHAAVFDDFVGTLELYEWLGFSAEAIVELATAESARLLGIGDRTGQLTPGYRADLVVVDGDPLTDLSALRAVRLVVANGRSRAPAGLPPEAGR